jgi:hypothetical protein
MIFLSAPRRDEPASISPAEALLHSSELARCEREIMLATYALMTGRDPVDCRPVSVSDALLYLTDWEMERTYIIRAQEQTTMRPTSTSQTQTPQLSAAETLAAVESFWQDQPCSVCATPGATCPHRAPAFAQFQALLRGGVEIAQANRKRGAA